MSSLRLARFLARAGVVSRRGAADLIRSGRVEVNGAPPTGPGDPVDPDRDLVTLDGRRLALVRAQWLALHKPTGYVTSRRATGRYPSVYSLLPRAPAGIVAVGRLDVFTEGLLLCTTDGDAAHRLMHPSWRVPRTYEVLVTGALPRGARALLAHGVRLDDQPPVRPTAWRFTPARGGGRLVLELAEGRSRVVRRLAARLGLGIRRLVRTGYGPIRLGALAAGQARPLAPRELAALYRTVELPLPVTSAEVPD